MQLRLRQSRDPARDDYAGQDVKGKIVLLLAGAPGEDPHSPLMEFAGIRNKALTARNLGAAAILVVLPKDSDAPHMTADEIHQIGLREIDRIETEMTVIAKKEGFADLAAFRATLKTNPKYIPT